jgi:hypothetical protein
MPIARIYASQVEEAEPICADLLARGYNVEVVFPDAVLSNPADLELRVERCSAEEAVARVEASGSSSRCVFMTPSKGPRRELLLVEMTVLATGTDGRHPMMPLTTMPLAVVPHGPVPVSEKEPVATVATSSSAPAETAPSLAEVLPFPVVLPEAAVETPGNAVQSWPVTEGDGSLSKHLIFELNAFLAHAPVVERPDGLYVKWFENVRQSVHVDRARKNWEGLTLAGVAASLLLLMLLGWYAGPGPSREVAKSSASARPAAAVSGTASGVSAAATLPEDGLRSVGLKMATPSASRNLGAGHARLVRRETRVESGMQDEVIAQDHVTKVVRRTVSKGWSAPPSQPTASELVEPAAIRSAPKSAPIKIITDLK